MPRSEIEWLGLELALARFFLSRDACATILTRLCRSAGRVVSADRLTLHTSINPDSVKFYICYLREDMADLGFQGRVETIRGEGYRVSPGTAEEVWGRVLSSLEHLAEAA